MHRILENCKQVIFITGTSPPPCQIITHYIWGASSASFIFNYYKVQWLNSSATGSVAYMCILKVANFFLTNCQKRNSERFLRFLHLKIKIIYIFSFHYDLLSLREEWEVPKISIRIYDPGQIRN